MGTRTAGYGWMVTYDHIADDTVAAPSNSNAKGMQGPHDIAPDVVARLEAAAKARGRKAAVNADPDIKWFRMYDDDGEVYYTGAFLALPGYDGYEEGFEPLEDFGTPNAGAVRIDYLTWDEDGEAVWSTL